MVIDYETKDRQKRSSICLTRLSEKDNKNNGIEQILKTVTIFSVEKREI